MIPQTSIAQGARTFSLPAHFDEDGFLAESECWTLELADQFAPSRHRRAHR